MKYIWAVLIFVISFSVPHIVSAQATPQKRFGEWVVLRAPYLDGRNSCQAIQCASGNCSTKKFFLLNTTSGEDYIIPTFNQGFMQPANSQVQLVISGKSYNLFNKRDKSDRFFSPRTAKDVVQIGRSLTALAKSGGARKFHVIDIAGRKRSFSARGADKSYAEINYKCDVPLP
jgi:hypothetical protein